MSDQPKPATEHRGVEWEHREHDQPKPTTGEWTAESVRVLFEQAGTKCQYGWKAIADAHNAALDAEREKPKGIGMVHDAVIESQFQQLHEQLSTAVEALKVIEIGHGVDARTARAALAKVKDGK